MKKSFLLAGCFAASLTLFACGDSSSDASNVDIEDNSSSSEAVESSSSEEVAESSAAAPRERAATLDDLVAHKNKILEGLFGTDILIASGSQKGLISMWLPRKEATALDSAWVVVQSDFKGGVLEINSKNAVFLASKDVDKDKGAGTAMYEMVTKGAKLKFIVNKEGKLQYSLNGGDFKAVAETAVVMPDGYVTNGDELKNKRLSCNIVGDTENDTTYVYSFYDGRYIAEKVKGGDTLSWAAGYSDIQKGKLFLMKPEMVSGSTMISPLRTASVKNNNDLEFVTGVTEKCTSAEMKVASVSRKDLAKTWNGSLDGDSWMMTLKDDGAFSMQNVKASAGRQGSWLLYGDIILMQNDACLPNDCDSGIKGNVAGFDAKKGFTFNHPDKSKIPSEWKVPVTE